MDKIVLDDDDERKMERRFNIAFDSEMEKSSQKIIKDISEMITDILNEEVEHRFEPFKEHIVSELRG